MTPRDNQEIDEDSVKQLILNPNSDVASLNNSSIRAFLNITKLNLPNCNLSNLPENLSSICPNLSILFAPNNHFDELHAVIGQCQQLQMVSFKDNNMKSIHPDALQSQLRWLILTGNQITDLPETIGRCKKLQKCMLSGNRLKCLPDSFDKLESLELIRLACNDLSEPPLKALQLRNLKWVALAGNPFLPTKKMNVNDSVSLKTIDDPIFHSDKQSLWEVLGQGAGGITRKVIWENKPVAVKTFAGEMTSDGSPQDEKSISVMAASLDDPSLISLYGQTLEGSLIMEFLQGYKALAGPPNFDTCSRDVYNYDSSMITEEFAWKIAMNLLKVLQRLHEKGICHGDFYGHNILISSSCCCDSSNVKLSDFGAAFFYDPSLEYGQMIEKIELRSYGVLVQELQNFVSAGDIERWNKLKAAVRSSTSNTFGDVLINLSL